MQETFSVIPDPRNPSYITHKLSDVLTIAACAVICGMFTLEDIADFAKAQLDLLKEAFGIDKASSKPTLSRILSVVDGAKTAELTIQYMKRLLPHREGSHIAIYGKSIRSTVQKSNPASSLQIITAMATESRIVLRQGKAS